MMKMDWENGKEKDIESKSHYEESFGLRGYWIGYIASAPG
jgi:hypothetical protein